jgi:hypothetical protein
MTAIFFHRIPRGWAPLSVSAEVTPAEARDLKAEHLARVAKAGGSTFRAYKPGEMALWKVTGTLTELYEAFGHDALGSLFPASELNVVTRRDS